MDNYQNLVQAYADQLKTKETYLSNAFNTVKSEFPRNVNHAFATGEKYLTVKIQDDMDLCISYEELHKSPSFIEFSEFLETSGIKVENVNTQYRRVNGKYHEGQITTGIDFKISPSPQLLGDASAVATGQTQDVAPTHINQEPPEYGFEPH